MDSKKRTRSNSLPPKVGALPPLTQTGLGRQRSNSMGERNIPPGQVRARQLASFERADPQSFIQARAHLAAALTGATVSQMMGEVKSARDRVNQWKSTVGQQVTTHQTDQIVQRVRQNDYVELKRFQSEDSHSKPRTEQDVTALQQIRNLHGGTYKGDPRDAGSAEPDHFGAAVIGARHTKGFNDSPFVSLASDPSKLLGSADDGPKGAKTIAEKAPDLHTYTVPKVSTWSPERMKNSMVSDPEYLNSPINGNHGETFKEWLEGTPTRETEVLFLGGDLDKYRTNKERNPYLPPPVNKRKGRRGKKQ